MAFEPTFEMAVYRSARIGMSALTVRPLCEKPLGVAEVEVLSPLAKALSEMGAVGSMAVRAVWRKNLPLLRKHMGEEAARLPVIEDQPTFGDRWQQIYDAARQGDVASLIVAQTELAWMLSGIAVRDMQTAVDYIMKCSSRSPVFQPFPETYEKIRDAMPGVHHGNGRKHIYPNEVLWTLARHNGWEVDAAKELGISKNRFEILVARLRATYPDFDRALKTARVRNPGFGIRPKNGCFQNEPHHCDFEPEYVKARILHSCAQMLNKAGVLTGSHIDALLGRAEMFEIAALRYGNNDRFFTSFETTLSRELRSFERSASV
jgi:hypothetical protein